MSNLTNLQSLFHISAVAPTIDTSPEALGLQQSSPKQVPSTPSRVKRLSAAVEKSVDRLSRSITARSGPTSPPTPPPAGRRRLFSLSRKGKPKDNSADPEGAPFSTNVLPDSLSLVSTLTPSVSRSTLPKSASASTSGVTPREGFPFFTTPVPVKPATKSGTSNDDSPFITPPSPPPTRPPLSPFRGDGSMRAGTQTLIQALQALPWAEVDDEDIEGPDASSSDEEEGSGQPSSIHTIHRPLARSKKLSITHPTQEYASSSSYGLVDEVTEEPETLSSEGEREPEDFEETPRLPSSPFPSPPPPTKSIIPSDKQTSRAGPCPHIRIVPSRAGSMGTIRLQRRAGLAQKLKEVFELDAIEQVRAGSSTQIGVTQQEGTKDKALDKTLVRPKERCSLMDPYFPHGIVDLRYAISCEAEGDKSFRIRTNQKTVVLYADSVPSREEWVKAIRKVIFKAQNMGDSVKIAIPYSLILDVDKSTAMDFSETIEVKVFDKDEDSSIDSYFFAYFHDLPGALEHIRDAVRDHRNQPDRPNIPATVLDTTQSRPYVNSDRTTSLLSSESNVSKSSSVFRLSSLLRPLRATQASVPETSTETEDFTHVSRRPNSSSFVPITTSPKSIEGLPETGSEQTSKSLLTSANEHTYPPSTSNSYIDPNHPSLSRESSSWVGVPSWLKGTRRVFGGSTPSDQTMTTTSAGVKEMYSSTTLSPSFPTSRSIMGDLAFSILETPNIPVDIETTEKFRTAFAYDEKETLLGSTEKSKATRFGHHGLIVIIKGHEELFFEFNAEDKRDAFIRLLDRQVEDVRKRLAQGETNPTSPGKRQALILEEFDATANECDPAPASASDTLGDSLPAVMFTSASSTFLTFKPAESLHFTFLTIGSRGDVQPYIALAKGLMADGHRCKIATHGEFKDWIESHGVEFGFVGGDPAELMRICVENGTFTVSFLKEGLLKFRGWLDDLLKTSWEACQKTDVLIESPSAMGGCHIAEALGIPYFRAFTMPWSRTRAYPHAFAVPDRKMGGSYNYMVRNLSRFLNVAFILNLQSYVMFDQVFWRATAGQINRWRRDLLHLPSTSLDKMEPHKIPFLYNFSPSVVPPPLDWPEWIRVTGYWFLDDAEVSAKKWTPPPDLVDFIDSAHKLGKKVVYIGFGSIVVSDPKTMTHCVIEAVIRSGVYAILSKGWSDRLHVKTSDASEAEEPLPKQIYAISSVPHDWLFQRIDAACHHGGAGTTGASLRAGIPTIIRPFFGDQLFWADRVEALGVGSGVRKLTVNSLTDALITATTDVKQIDRAKLLGEQIRSENGVPTAIECIYRDLEYARSLIKHVDNDDEDNNHTSIRDHERGSQSGYSSSGSVRDAPSEDWSVISEQDDRRSSLSSSQSLSKETSVNRTTFTAAVLSVLPNSLAPASPKSRHPPLPGP
ncbi:hypothetical protein C0995_014166 [Termitomyces sp. Mi166|nr:hypothetical protein C0995_014166 [Termitomyces sp. Mi166\